MNVVDQKQASDFEWLEPWRAVTDRAASVAELRREISLKHPLYGVEAFAVARRVDTDDVLFRLPGNVPPFAVVHLTWTGEREQDAEFPETIFYDSLEQFKEERMMPDHEDSDLSELRIERRVAGFKTGNQATHAGVETKTESSGETARRSGVMYAAVMSLVFSVLTCLIAGIALDRMFETSPWLVVAGIVVGAIVGFYQFIRFASRVE